MHRHRSTSYALVALTVAFAVGCSGSSEKKLLDDFFRASRLRDDVTLGNFATATFDPRTDGVVQSFDITTISEEKVVPLPLKQYAKAVDDAKAEDAALTEKRRAFYNDNQAAIKRFATLDAAGKPVPAKDQPLKATWDKWVADGAASRKGVSDKQRQLNASRGVAELSLSRPNGAMVDASKFDAQMATKEVLFTASVRQPDGQTASRNLKAVLQRARIKDDSGKDVIGRWIVTSIKPA
jgi:hypothetical protein